MKFLPVVIVLIMIFHCKAKASFLNNDSTIVLIKSDTIPCKGIDNDEYIYNYIQIETSNKQIENKLNYFFLRFDIYGNINEIPNNLDYSHLTFDQIYLTCIDSIKKLCNIAADSGLVSDLLDHSYDVLYNNANILTIFHWWQHYGYTSSTHDFYTIDLNNFQLLSINSVIQKVKQPIVYEMIKHKIDFITKEDFELNKEDSDYIELLNVSKKEYEPEDISNFIITRRRSYQRH